MPQFRKKIISGSSKGTHLFHDILNWAALLHLLELIHPDLRQAKVKIFGSNVIYISSV